MRFFEKRHCFRHLSPSCHIFLNENLHSLRLHLGFSEKRHSLRRLFPSCHFFWTENLHSLRLHLGFSENWHTSGAFFLHIKFLELKICMASGGAFVYSTFFVVVGSLLYVPLWSWLQWYLPLSTASKSEKLDVIVGAVEIGFS